MMEDFCGQITGYIYEAEKVIFNLTFCNYKYSVLQFNFEKQLFLSALHTLGGANTNIHW